MPHPLIERLRAQGTAFTPMLPVPGVVESFETDLGRELPEDCRAWLTEFGGGTLNPGGVTPLCLLHVEELWDALEYEEYLEHLPGMLVIGDSGGGDLYFYDPDGRMGAGEWSLWIVQMGVLDLARARFAGRSLSHAVERLLDGVDFMQQPVGPPTADG